MRSSRIFVVPVACLLTASCAPADVEGDWSGTWRVPLSGWDGTITMSLTQDGDAVSGTFDLGGTTCVGSGDVEGSVDNRQVDLELANGLGGRINIDARLNAASDGLDGDFHVTGGLCEGADGKVSLDKE
jgi:hypothetical protein